jgi:hypothetical protein
MRRRGQWSAVRSRTIAAVLALTLVLTLVLTFLAAPAAQATDVETLDGQCRSLLRRQVFDCTCTAAFLEAYLGAEQGEILMTLWALAPNENNQSLNLYLRFGRGAIDAAVMSFHRHRDRLRAYCPQGGPNVSD